MALAKDNEKIFTDLFGKKVRDVTLLKGTVYTIEDKKGRKLSSSVDHYFEHNGRQVLIELDSYNMAKVVVGQYLLLNQFRDKSLSNPVFLVIHAYKNYAPVRTIKYLEHVTENVIKEDSIPFGVIHIDSFKEWGGGDADAFIKLFNI
ncbi:hypothetical protein [Achromobacter sp. DH1f]|uniref:hypothetical protein n=1 Tax=Achromobacter sp. DH1f TaxID=1397275 RepID=UPI0012FF1403|nr:hypothetical protein [Achromobacter sp. DH1f]